MQGLTNRLSSTKLSSESFIWRTYRDIDLYVINNKKVMCGVYNQPINSDLTIIDWK